MDLYPIIPGAFNEEKIGGEALLNEQILGLTYSLKLTRDIGHSIEAKHSNVLESIKLIVKLSLIFLKMDLGLIEPSVFLNRF